MISPVDRAVAPITTIRGGSAASAVELVHSAIATAPSASQQPAFIAATRIAPLELLWHKQLKPKLGSSPAWLRSH